ncbi:ComF family protein [Rubritalea tangerina]|uniref:ComF family protein n=1 Tax=Rubritalea tangerina TaxID=430798 RepID=A0ABW4ZE46_9BACT
MYPHPNRPSTLPLSAPTLTKSQTRIAQLLDLLYPPSCHLCERPTTEGRYLCDQCYVQRPRLIQPFCETCGESYSGVLPQHFLCPNCSQHDFPFLFARAALLNTNQNHQLIVDFKYLKKFYLAKELARFCAEIFETDPRFKSLNSPTLIPIPLHWRRQWQRGFNQAHALAQQLSHLTHIPLTHCLKRARHTHTQTKLIRSERLSNLRDAFKVNDIPPHFSSAILIDDVFTTGATTSACAQALQKHAPQLQNIVVLTALRG